MIWFFCSENWNEFQIVELTPENDTVRDGPIKLSVLAFVETEDIGFREVQVAPVDVIVEDDDPALLAFTREKIITSEDGDREKKIEFYLNGTPKSEVTLTATFDET